MLQLKLLSLLLVLGPLGVIGQPDIYSNDRDPSRNTYNKPLWPGTGDLKMVPLFKCVFRNSTCHFQHQHNMQRFKHFTNNQRPIFGAQTALLLDMNEPEAKKHAGGRLITHYFPSEYRNSCMKITYMWLGKPRPGAERKLNVIQQDKKNHCLFTDKNNPDTQNTGKWLTAYIQLNVDLGDPRFFFEIIYNPRLTQRGEYFVFSEFIYHYGDCPEQNNNGCMVD